MIVLTQFIYERLLSKFSPSYLRVKDESDLHKGHSGYHSAGSHFAIIIQADSLQSISLIAAHREIYQLLADQIPDPIHALRIEIKVE